MNATRLVSDPLSIKQRTCQECGMLLGDAGEFHPQAFCVWKKAGLDPWDALLWIVRQLGQDITHWPKRPPLIRDIRSQRGGVPPGKTPA